MYEFLSDLDMAYNKETGEYDIFAVEWDGMYGKYWQYFSTEEEREEAIERNALAQLSHDLQEVFERFEGELVELEGIYKVYSSVSSKKSIADMVCSHNKAVMKLRKKPTQPTYSIGLAFPSLARMVA